MIDSVVNTQKLGLYFTVQVSKEARLQCNANRKI